MKISLNKPASGYNLAAINDNFTKLETEFQTKVLYRNNPSGEPNTMETDLDMNGHAIYNLSELQIGGVNISEINSALIWRGTWNSGTTYAISDAVYYNGSSYIAVAANTNSTPPSANWNVLAAQGASGAGTGDVVGPASSTLNNIALYASGTGKLLKDSSVTLALGGAVESFLESATAAAARSAIGAGTAMGGANADITSLTALTSPVAEVRQIQPISASVSGNALTISASALALEFRSTTLGSGAVSFVEGTPANLVISSGSTLGTINGQQSDIVVLAMNNAGTIELAAVNIAGGNDLTETGLITTTAEGGAGAADSASVIYSTTARTNLAYRVLGIIRSTQATAGTWVTSPSLIQGQGGQAVAAMSSVGYGQSYQDFTGVGGRSSGVTMYNTRGKPITASVTALVAGGGGTLSGNVNGNQMTLFQNNGGSAQFMTVCLPNIPPGRTYSVTNSSGTITTWMEQS